ncbi:hypothetical protein FRC00_008785 [Tulasnella sp. 408]|nr:hypothetical protein FRC00_008785 [Tulasnella sp. 408]
MSVPTKTVNSFTTAIGLSARLIPLPFQLFIFATAVFILHARDTVYTVRQRRRDDRLTATDEYSLFDVVRLFSFWPFSCLSVLLVASSRKAIQASMVFGLNTVPLVKATPVVHAQGILPRNGRHITYKEMSQAIQKAFNLSPTLGDREFALSSYALTLSKRMPLLSCTPSELTSSALLVDQGRGWIDLGDLNALGVTTSLSSLTKELPILTWSSASSNMRPTARKTGVASALEIWPTTTDSVAPSAKRAMESSGNCALLYSIFDGDAEDLKVFLEEERFPHGWEPKVRSGLGHTILFAQITTLMVEFNTHEKQKLRPGDYFYNQKLLKLKSQ